MDLIPRIKDTIKGRFPFLLPSIAACLSVLMYLPSKLKVRRLLKERDEIFIEAGSGNKKGKDGWLTIDITLGCDIFWDLRSSLPFPDKSVSRIYSSHFLEHFSFKEGQRFLDECKRVLVPGGLFLICVPNARLYIEAYMKSDPLDKAIFFFHKPAYNNTTKIDYVNYTAYMGGIHKYMFDEENLLYLLRSKGFKNVRIRDFDPLLDRKERAFESIYAEAER